MIQPRHIIVLVLVVALLAGATGAVIASSVQPAQARTPDSEALRQIARNTLQTRQQLERVRTDLARLCRAIPDTTFCP